MKKILIAVDETKGSMVAIRVFNELFSGCPEIEAILLNVEQFGGKSVLHDRISDTDISVLMEALEGTEIGEALKRKSEKTLEYHKKSMEEKGVRGIKTIIKAGHPAEEILNTAKEEGAEMIIVGSRGKRMHTLLLGSISREISNRADIPVLIAR